MRIKKSLQTAGVTLLGTAILLLVGSSLFLGVWALLPDRTGETHSYTIPTLPAEAGQGELYPWDRMTSPWEDGVGSLEDEELFDLLTPLLPPQLSPDEINWEGSEFLRDETQTMVGFRNVEVRLRAYTNMIVEKDGVEVVVSDTESVLPYRFSLALRERYGEVEVCFVSLEPPSPEGSLPTAEEAGLTALTEWAEKRDLHADSGSPFADFLWCFVDFCVMLECDEEVYNAALLLFGTGACEITSEGQTVYCSFTGREGKMTLLCDPVGQTVYGISLQRNS